MFFFLLPYQNLLLEYFHTVGGQMCSLSRFIGLFDDYDQATAMEYFNKWMDFEFERIEPYANELNVTLE
jgi:hypothetical protein